MSETITIPPDDLIDTSDGPTAAPTIEAAPSAAGDSTILPLETPADLHTMLELIGHGLTADVSETTRAAARELWSRLSQLIAAVVPALAPTSATTAPAAQPAAPAAPAMPASPPLPQIPPVPAPTTPIATAARMLRQVPPEQLLDLLLHRLRAALPKDAAVPTPRAIQFQLVPVPQSRASR